jgi:hypothetical protein
VSKSHRKKHAALLGALACALNNCEKAGLRMRLDWAAWCHQGVVMPPQRKDRRDGWAARPFGVLPQSPPENGSDED